MRLHLVSHVTQVCSIQIHQVALMIFLRTQLGFGEFIGRIPVTSASSLARKEGGGNLVLIVHIGRSFIVVFVQ
jgi:hypothetical protein